MISFGLFIGSFLLLLLVQVLGFTFLLKKKSHDSGLLQRLDEVDKKFNQLEQAFREEFRFNRDENSKNSKETREELVMSQKELKKELADSLKQILEHNSGTLKELHRTLDEKLQLMIKTSKEAHGELRLELEKSMKSVQENFD